MNTKGHPVASIFRLKNLCKQPLVSVSINISKLQYPETTDYLR